MRTRTIRHLLLAAAIAVAGTVAVVHAQRGATASGARRVVLAFQGRMREYLLYVPASPNGALVLAFHGGGQSAAQMQQITGFDTLADREHFLVAYPEAIERSWADGRNVTSAEKQGVDDIGFAKSVIADIARTHAVNPSRVFATGLSNGGMLTHRIGCEAADTFAAIAPVIASIPTRLVSSCRPRVPVAVMSIQGTADPSVRFDGGFVGGGPAGGELQGSRATQELWRSLNGCSTTVTTTPMPVRVQDGTSVERRLYASCRGHGEVIWYEIKGGGHWWPPFPGPDAPRVQPENGVSSQNLNASEMIWAFFAGHARR